MSGFFFFSFLLSLAKVFQVLRQNSLVMAITKAGKQLYKFDTQFILNIFDKNYTFFFNLLLKMRGEQQP